MGVDPHYLIPLKKLLIVVMGFIDPNPRPREPREEEIVEKGKHTEGPYRVWPTHWAGGSRMVQLNGKNVIYIECDGPYGVLCAIRHHGKAGQPTEEDWANAELFRSAPEIAADLARLREENRRLREACEVVKCAVALAQTEEKPEGEDDHS